MLFDTHAHLDSDQFNDQRDAVVQRAKAAGLVGMMTIGTTAASSRRACDLAAEYPGYVYAAVGIQPNYVGEVEADDWQTIEELAGFPGVRAIGETGLDQYWDDTPLVEQIDYFQRHIELSQKVGLPFIVHMRESCPAIIDTLRPYAAKGSLAGVMHSFTGDWDQAKQLLDFGLHISFAGMLTFKKSQDLRGVAAQVPEDRLLIETDAPYLSPEPLRGKRPNEPARVAHTLKCLAEVRGKSVESMAEITTHNARRFLALPE
ncbi:putative deoxyribonuclease YcfH [Roseimaritima multifibrata]|uniref:Putative deoxyribonuclease YcfH n=1 Tax=Roseimaritima multifibrata TaxID=1930274 RepID=A0A517MHQ1_9BACT|nr:TatD family hydrolase [Roseimaritima multifibrata]QDS94307.1 putative deoxyribonuclease YcfH [Roseimaritima multifibrata]